MNTKRKWVVECFFFVLIFTLTAYFSFYRVLDTGFHVDLTTYSDEAQLTGIQPHQSSYSIRLFLIDFKTYLKKYLENDFQCSKAVGRAPLQSFFSRLLLGMSGSYFMAAHYPQAFLFSLSAALLFLFLGLNFFGLSLWHRFYVSCIYALNTELISVTHIGWLQTSAITFLLLHWFCFYLLMHKKDSKNLIFSFLLLILLSITALFVVTWQGYILTLCFSVCLLILAFELRTKDKWFQKWPLLLIYLLSLTPSLFTIINLKKCQMAIKADMRRLRGWDIVTYFWGINQPTPFYSMIGILTFLLSLLGVYYLYTTQKRKLLWLIIASILIHFFFLALFYNYINFRFWVPIFISFFLLSIYGIRLIETQIHVHAGKCILFFSLASSFYYALDYLNHIRLKRDQFSEFKQKILQASSTIESRAYSGKYYALEFDTYIPESSCKELMKHQPHYILSDGYSWELPEFGPFLTQNYQAVATDTISCHLYERKK